MIDEDFDLLDAARAVIEVVQQVEVAEARLVGEEGEVGVLRAVAERGVGDELGLAVVGGEGGRFRFEGERGHLAAEVVEALLRVDLTELGGLGHGGRLLKR